jgi:CheY-like chemotaxis protein
MAQTILVVDDDTEVLSMVRTVLEEKGFNVITAADGKHCMREIIVKKPDLIVMDIRMPNMDGMNALDMIKVTNLGREVPILMWSGEADRDTMAKAEKLGADDFVVKSIPMPEFARRVAAHLFAVDYTVLQDVLNRLPEAKETGPVLTGINPTDYPDWELHTMIYSDMELCVFLAKSIGGFEGLSKVDEEKSHSQVAVFHKIRNKWKRLWPKG